MRISAVTVSAKSGSVRLTSTIQSEDAARPTPEVYIDYHVADAAYVRASPETMAAAALLPAMRAGEHLSIIPEMSPRLCFNLPRIRDIFHSWWPDFARIDIASIASASSNERPASRAATFFSGGVDSFYTLLKHRSGAGSFPVPMPTLFSCGGSRPGSNERGA